MQITATANFLANFLIWFIFHDLLSFLQTELAAQKEALDTEHCRALETLKKQVLTQCSPHYLQV